MKLWRSLFILAIILTSAGVVVASTFPPTAPTRPGQSGGPINPGDTVSGYLPDCAVSQNWSFFGNQGDVVDIGMYQQSGDLDPYITLVHPSGLRLDDDDGQGFPNAGLTAYTLPQMGMYTIEATCYGQTSGDYTLSLALTSGSAGQPGGQPSSGGGTLSYGDTGTGTFADCSTAHIWMFSGSSQDVVNITMNSTLVDSYLTLRAPSGQVVTSDDDSGTGYDAFIGGVTLSETGTYSIEATCLSGSGGYGVSVDLDATAGQPAGSSWVINYGETVTGTVTACTSPNVWTFDGTAGDVVDISMIKHDNNLDPFITLHLPNGTTIVDDDSLGDFNAGLIGYTLPETGMYVIDAGCFGTTFGSYNLTLQATTVGVPPVAGSDGTIGYGQARQGFLASCDAGDLWTFEGTTGDIVNITMLADTGDVNPYMNLFAPDNSTIASDHDTAGYPNAWIRNFTLPQTGTYAINTLCVEGTGDYTVMLELGPTTRSIATYQVAVIVDLSSEPVTEQQAQTTIDEASDILFELTGFRLEMVDFMPITPSNDAERNNLPVIYLGLDPVIIPNTIVVFSYGVNDDARSFGGYSYPINGPADFVNVFQSVVPGSQPNQIDVSMVHYSHRYAECGYGGTDLATSQVSVGGECQNQPGTACVERNGYSMCSTAVDSLYASTPSYFRAATVVHEIMHAYGENGNQDHFGTQECQQMMGWGPDDLPDGFTDFSVAFEYYNGMCPYVYDNFSLSYRQYVNP